MASCKDCKWTNCEYYGHRRKICSSYVGEITPARSRSGRVNLYTFLIDIDSKYIFGSVVNNMIESGLILVNGAKPDDINMALDIGDTVKVLDDEYEVE